MHTFTGLRARADTHKINMIVLVGTDTKISSIIINYYPYLVIHRKVKLTH